MKEVEALLEEVRTLGDTEKKQLESATKRLAILYDLSKAIESLIAELQVIKLSKKSSAAIHLQEVKQLLAVGFGPYNGTLKATVEKEREVLGRAVVVELRDLNQIQQDCK